MAEQYPELWIIEPKAAYNLIANPSFELATTTGYTSVAASHAVDTTTQRRGVYSLKTTPNSGAYAYTGYSMTLTDGVEYAFSVDVKDVSAQAFYLIVYDNLGAVIGQLTWTGDGHWKRKAVSFTANANQPHTVYVHRPPVASTEAFYTDGWQVEAGEESTYFDGDSNGWNRQRRDYYWTGTPHASTSYRSAQTRTGGTLLRVRDYAKILGIEGMGMAPVENNAIPVGRAGSQYQNTRINDREMTVYLRFYGATTDAMRRNRAAISAALSMDNVPADEPIVLRWRLEDTSGTPMSETLDIPCLYSGGMEDDTSQPASQIVSKAAVNFTAFNPYLELDGEAGAALGFSGTITQTQYAVYRDAAGQWKSLGSINGPVYAYAQAPSGSVIAGGAYTIFGGAAGTGVMSLTGTASAQVGTGVPGTTYAVAVDAGGTIYSGGNNPGGGLRYNTGGSAWTIATTSLGGSVSGQVYTIVPGDDGRVYFGGAYVLGTGEGNNAGFIYTPYFTYCTNMGTGVVGTCTTMAYANDTVFAGANAGGTAKIYTASPGGTVWSTLYTSVGTTNSIQASKFGPDGRYYYAGQLQQNIPGTSGSAEGVSTGRIYAGTTNRKVIGSINDSSSNIYALAWDNVNNQYAAGQFFKDFQGGSISDPTLTERGGVWGQLDIDTGCGTAEAIRAILITKTNEMYLGGDWTSGTATTASVTVANSTTARAYPRVIFTGPGKVVQLVNYSTGKAIYFNNLVLLNAERAIFDFRPGRFSFVSSWRGNLMKYLSAGADADFYLLGGNNNISAYMTATTANSKILMAWQPVYNTLDGAVW